MPTGKIVHLHYAFSTHPSKSDVRDLNQVQCNATFEASSLKRKKMFSLAARELQFPWRIPCRKVCLPVPARRWTANVAGDPHSSGVQWPHPGGVRFIIFVDS